MADNYGFILLLSAVVTGLIILSDKYYFRSARDKMAACYRLITPEEELQQSELKKILQPFWLIDFSRSFFPVILLVLLVRSFGYEPFRIPSGSMQPTLNSGDFILVEKFRYGLRLSGFANPLIKTAQPGLGDVIVFRHPDRSNEYYIKRVVALPGDRILYKDKKIAIVPSCTTSTDCPDKQEIQQQLIADASYYDQGTKLELYREKLGKDTHEILLNPTIAASADDNEWTVPDAHYFVMGDNRDDSNDSRAWGFVSEQELVGKAVAVWIHMDYENSWSDWFPSSISFHNNRLIK